MYAVQKMSEYFGRTSLMKCWNEAGEFVSPKGIIMYSKCPKWERKAVFHSPPFSHSYRIVDPLCNSALVWVLS